jgi:UDP-N-acetylglucosamine 2-epimerase (non-hydrolysing)
MPVKILIVLGTRPEVIKLAPLIKLLKESELKDHFVVASTSQHDELLDEQLAFWNITPDYYLTPCPFKKKLVRLLSHTLSGLQDIVEQIETVEYVIVQGDTNTALACANLAFLNQLKLIHIEAGLRSFDLKNPFPEEFNRIVASKVAHFHFAPTELSKQNLMSEGVSEKNISVIGNTVIDALMQTQHVEAVPDNKRNLALITLHRRENIESNYIDLIAVINELASEHPEITFIWITHPNCFHKISSGINPSKNMEIRQHMPYGEFITLYQSAKIVFTDSGGVTEEAIQMEIPVIVFREKTERLEPLENNYPMILSMKKEEIISFFRKTLVEVNNNTYSYGNGKASEEIVKWLAQKTLRAHV